MKKGIGPRGLGAPKSAAKMYSKSPAKQTNSIKPKDAKTVSDSTDVEYEYIANTRPGAYSTIFRKADESVERRPGYSPNPKQRSRDLLDNTRSIASRFGIDTKKAYKK